MAKSFFDLRDDIFETLTEASALERRAEREQKQADMAKVAADQDRKRRRAREARQDYSRERKRSLEMGEGVKVGDTVHLGHGTKGGTGVKGKVHKIDGKMVHIKNDKGAMFKGPMDRVSTTEAYGSDEERKKREREDIAALHKKGDKEGIARIMAARAKEKKRMGEAIKYDSAGDSTGTVTGKGKRDRESGGKVKVTYKGSETYKDDTKLPIKARDVGRLIRQARKKGTTPYDSRNLRNPRLAKDHVEYETNEAFDKLTPAQERDADRRLKPTRATVAKVRLRAGEKDVAKSVKKHQSEKGGNPGNTKKRRKRDLRLRDHVELEEAKSKDIVKGLTDMDGPFTVVAIKNNKVIKQEGTKMRNMLPAIVKMMRKEVGRGVTIGIEDRKGTIRNTFKEAVKPAMRMGVDFKYKAPSEEDKAAMKREREKAAKMRSTPDTSAAGRAAQRMIDARKKTEESVEQVDELKKSTLMSYKDKAKKSERSGRDTGFEGETPSEREAGARQVKKRMKGIDRATKKLVARQYEDVEQVDELMMPAKDSEGKIERGKIRAALRRGAQKADLKADKALRKGDAEGAEGHMTRSRKRQAASKDPEKAQRESVEQVDELKSSTLRSYLDKARKDNQTRVTRMADQPDHMSADKGEMKKLRKRRKGSEAAASRLDARKHNLEPKLKREEIEQVDELDTKTMKSYVHKASGQVRGDLSTGKHSPKTNKRAKGVAKAKTDLDMRKIAGKDYRKRMG